MESVQVRAPWYEDGLRMRGENAVMAAGVANDEIIAAEQRHGGTRVVIDVSACDDTQFRTQQDRIPPALFIEEDHLDALVFNPAPEIGKIHRHHSGYHTGLPPSDVSVIPFGIVDRLTLSAPRVDEDFVLALELPAVLARDVSRPALKPGSDNT